MLKKFVNYDKDNVELKLWKKLRPYVNDPELSPESLCKKSKAAGGLGVWVRGIYIYVGICLN